MAVRTSVAPEAVAATQTLTWFLVLRRVPLMAGAVDLNAPDIRPIVFHYLRDGACVGTVTGTLGAAAASRSSNG